MGDIHNICSIHTVHNCTLRCGVFLISSHVHPILGHIISHHIPLKITRYSTSFRLLLLHMLQEQTAQQNNALQVACCADGLLSGNSLFFKCLVPLPYLMYFDVIYISIYVCIVCSLYMLRLLCLCFVVFSLTVCMIL